MARYDILGQFVLTIISAQEEQGASKRFIMDQFAELFGPWFMEFRESNPTVFPLIREGSWADRSARGQNPTAAKRGIEDALTRLFRKGRIVRRNVYRRSGTDVYNEYEYFTPDVVPRQPGPDEVTGPVERA